MYSANETAVLIPAYKPTEELIPLTERLMEQGYQVVVVNDGSGAESERIFDSLNSSIRLLTHETNKGKGCALKTGFAFIQANLPDCKAVVTADADGQHALSDIIRVGETLDESSAPIVLGSRHFEGRVPLKSRIGNTVTRWIFSAASKVNLYDTQTGLRGFVKSLFSDMAAIEGEGYEYEINVLLWAAEQHVPITEIPIETVYLNENASSHFHVIRDSFRIYSRIVKFSVSSLISFLIDYGLFILLKLLLTSYAPAMSLLYAAVGARIVSSLCNFLMNKTLVFKSNGNFFVAALKYYLLAGTVLGLNYAIMYVLNLILGVPLWITKPMTDLVLFILSYQVQKHLIFKEKQR